MRTMLKEVLKQLLDPGASSPLVPLFLVFVVFVGVFGAIIFLVGKMLRAPEAGEDNDTDHVPESVMGLFREESAFKRFFRRLSPFSRKVDFDDESSTIPSVASGDLTYLKEKVDRLERENTHFRELHAESLKEIAAAKMRTEAIETQLKEAISEVERLYKSNAESAGVETKPLTSGGSDLTGVVATNQQVILKQTETIDRLSGQLNRLTEENEKLRGLLMVCRTQIVEILSRQSSPPPATVAASAK